MALSPPTQGSRFAARSETCLRRPGSFFFRLLAFGLCLKGNDTEKFINQSFEELEMWAHIVDQQGYSMQTKLSGWRLIVRMVST